MSNVYIRIKGPKCNLKTCCKKCSQKGDEVMYMYLENFFPLK